MLMIIALTKMQNILYKKKYCEYVERYAKEYNVNENLIYAIIKDESNFKSNVVSNKKAVGLMQIMENTARDLISGTSIEIDDDDILEKLKDANININLGTKYLSILIEKYGNIELAVASYNAGNGTVDNWIKNGVIKADGSDIENIPYKETNNYVRKVLRDYEIYKKI